MSPLQSNTDAILLAIPMIAALLIAVFRLDELICRSPNRPINLGRPLCQWDQNGSAVLVEPDGRLPRNLQRMKPRLGAASDARLKGMLIRRPIAARRVSFDWVEGTED